MRNMKKLMAAVLALCMVLSLAVPAFAAELPFDDVSTSDWSYEYIKYAYENGLMKGESDTFFNREGVADRAMFATILWRVEGQPETYSENPFTDLEEDWYVTPVIWAFETGVTQGTGEGTYGPYDQLQREQLATMLYRYVGNKGIATNESVELTAFPDAAMVSDWALEAMQWAVAVGLVSGDDRGDAIYLDPQGDATREQLATILTRFVKAYGAGTEKNPIFALELEYDVTLAAGESIYYQGRFDGMDLTVNGDLDAAFSIAHNDQAAVAVDGTATLPLTAVSNYQPAVFSITNDGEEEATYHISITYPVGTMLNPEVLFGVAQINADLPEGLDQGYYYSWTSNADGTLVLSCETFDAEVFDIIVTTSSSYSQHLMSESGDGTVSVEVGSGDTVTIQVAALPNDQWVYPALQTTITGEFLFAGGSMNNPAQLVLGENTVTIEAGDVDGYFMTYTADQAGTLTIDMPDDMGWMYTINNLTTYVYGDTQWSDSDPVVDPAVVTVNAGDQLQINVSTYDPADMWNTPAGTLVMVASFTPGEGTGENPGDDDDEPVEKEEYIVNYDVQLALGDNALTLDETAVTTVYEFCPEEAGEYSFTADSGDAKVGYWGAGSFFVSDQTENKTNTLTYSLTNAGPSIMVGISGVESCTLTVTRLGDAKQEPVIETVAYENTVTPEAYSLTLGEDEALVYVDVTDGQADAAVLGEDGYYHLNTADGPVLLADLNNSTASLVGAMSYGQTKAAVYNEDGSVAQIVDYYAALEEYTACMDEAKSVYPLTADLMQMLQHLGSTKGWYDADVLGFYLFGDITVDPDTAWLFACCYVE